MTEGPWGGEPGNEDLDPFAPAPPLDAVRDFVARFVAFPSKSALDAVTLWAAHAHLVHVGENSPRLALLSPEWGSGKTRTLEILELLVPRPMYILNASAPPIFRSIGSDDRPCLLFDEVDAIFGGRPGKDDGNEDLWALLNSGHRKGASIPRCVGPQHSVEKFPTFAAVALAGLGDLPDTLMSRSVIVRMRRRAPGEHVEPFRRRLHEPAGSELQEQLAAWAQSVADRVRDAWPKMPAGITDRPADVWEPLLAVADAAGGHWPVTARTACIELAKVAQNRDASLGVKLLTDIRDVLDREGTDRLSTERLLDSLHKLDESPWADLRGKPLDARGLARRLRQYDARPHQFKVNDDKIRGYSVPGSEKDGGGLFDAFTRYLPPRPPVSGTSGTSGTDPESERESPPDPVPDRQSGTGTGAGHPVPDRAGSERESPARTAGTAGTAPVGTEAAAGPVQPLQPVHPEGVGSAPLAAEPGPYERVCRDCPELIPKHHVTCRPCAHRAMYPPSARQGDAPMAPVERDQ